MKLNYFRPVLVTLCMVLAASSNPLSPSAKAAGDKKLNLAFVSNNGAPFWTIARAGTVEAVKSLDNVEVTFRIPSSGSAAEQQQILNDLVASGIDGIAVSPIDPGNQTAFLNNIASHTLLVCHDSDAPASKRVCYIGTDNVAAGTEAAKMMKEVLPDGGKIMIFVGTLDAQNAKDRYAGIKKELEGSKIEIIDVRTDDTDPVRARKNVEDTLVKYPDIAGLMGLWSYNGPAIFNAVKAAGKAPGQIKIVCFDEDNDTLRGVTDGYIYGTVVQQPFEFGRQAIIKMAAYLRGDTSALAGGKQIIPTMDIKKDGVAAFQARLKQLLGK